MTRRARTLDALAGEVASGCVEGQRGQSAATFHTVVELHDSVEGTAVSAEEDLHEPLQLLTAPRIVDRAGRRSSDPAVRTRLGSVLDLPTHLATAATLDG